MLEEINELIRSSSSLSQWELSFLTEVKLLLHQGREIKGKREEKVRQILLQKGVIKREEKTREERRAYCPDCHNSSWRLCYFKGERYARRCHCSGGDQWTLQNLYSSGHIKQAKNLELFMVEYPNPEWINPRELNGT